MYARNCVRSKELFIEFLHDRGELATFGSNGKLWYAASYSLGSLAHGF